MEQFFVGIESYLIYGYSLSLIVSILFFKNINTHVACAVTMIFFEIITSIESPLYDFILTLGIHYGRVVWYLSWILFSLLSIWFMEYLHKTFSLKRQLSFSLIRIAFIALIFINIFDFIDRYTFNFDDAWFLILIAKSSIQIGIVTALLLGFFQKESQPEDIPHAAHNRSISWYQSLQNLPPLQRAKEMEKWEDFTKELPSDNKFN